MDKEKHSKPLTEITSPSRITDYFSSKKELHNDLTQDKESCDKQSSVYLTPKSSPAKDNEENHISQDLIHSDDVLKAENDKSHSSITISSDVHACEPHGSPERCAKTAVNVHDTRTPSRLNGCVSNHVISSDSSKRKSNQHRICQITRSSAAVHPEKGVSPHQAAVESVPMSSPSLPQPKVRKNSRPVRADSQVNSSTQIGGAKPKSGRRKKPEPVQSTAITDYFPIRRSGRQTKSQIEKETQIHLEKLIMSNYEDGLQVKEFEGKGRGIMATKVFDKGDYVIEYAGNLLDMDTARDREAHYALTPSIGCYMYFFNYKNKQYCVDATSESGRLGRLINHSRNGNCSTKVVMVDDKPRLILVAAKYIKEGEELSYDYGDRSKAALDAHPWLKL